MACSPKTAHLREEFLPRVWGGGGSVAEYSQVDGVVSDDFGNATHEIPDAQYVELMPTYNNNSAAADYANVFFRLSGTSYLGTDNLELVWDG